MIRFLILCTVFFLLYLGFNTISDFDSTVNILALDYKIQTTFFTLLSIFIVAQLILVVVLKTVFLVFDLPFLVKRSWHRRKTRRTNEQLLKVISEFFMGNREKSLELAVKMIPDFSEHNKELANLILAESSCDFDQQIHLLRGLIDKKNYIFYAAKKLAQVFFDHGYYMEAEEYATKAFNDNDTDTSLMIMLIRIYKNTSNWPKMLIFVAKLRRADVKLLMHHAEEISSYYYWAAKAFLVTSDTEETIKFLEASLELKPDYLEALNLFTEINVNINNAGSTLKILKSAFAGSPSFEIAQMYIKCSRGSVNAVYGTLAGLAKPSENSGLFLAIAAYLGLDDKIADLKAMKSD